MIKTEYLRLGNLVNLPNFNQIGIVLGIHKDGSISFLRNDVKMYEVANVFEAIPLTELNLITLGFKKKDHFEYRISALLFRIYRGGNIWYSYIGDIYLGDLIQNVHELQNFIHAFGKELIYTE
jgi:hypothetical protein